MRVPISGITVGFRIIKGSGKDASDYAKLFLVQAGDKDHDADLVTIYIQDLGIIEQCLNEYANGELRWVDTFCNQIVDGREKVWMIEKIFSLSKEQIYVEG